MAVRLNGNAANYLTRSSSVINPNNNYSYCFWGYLISDQNNYSVFVSLGESGGNNHDGIATDADGTTLRMFVNTIGGNGVNGSALTVGVWYHIGVVRSSATSCVVYLNGVLDITHTNDVTSRSWTALVNRVGVQSNDTFPLNGRVAALKMWDTNLTEAEIQQEMRQFLPFRTNNLHTWTPFTDTSTGTDFLDYSGNARNWTEAGSVTSEDGPPIPWRQGRKKYFIPLDGAAVPSIDLVFTEDSNKRSVLTRGW